MKTLAVAIVFGFGFAAFGMGVAAQDFELSESGYEAIEIGEVSHGNIEEGEFAGWKLFTKSTITACAKRVARDGSATYKCQEVLNPPATKSLFGFPKAAGRVLAIMAASPALSPEKSEVIYRLMQQIPEVSHGPIQEGAFAGRELFTKSALVVHAKMVGPDGPKFVKKLMNNPALE